MKKMLQIYQAPSQATDRVPEHQAWPPTTENDPDDDVPKNVPNDAEDFGNLDEDFDAFQTYGQETKATPTEVSTIKLSLLDSAPDSLVSTIQPCSAPLAMDHQKVPVLQAGMIRPPPDISSLVSIPSSARIVMAEVAALEESTQALIRHIETSPSPTKI